jgi:hypothetical protein
MVEVNAVSRNISLGGLLLEVSCPMPDRSPIEFTIILGGSIPRSILLSGAGVVVRVEPGNKADTFGIAVACSEPIRQIEEYLSGQSR